MFVVRFGLGLGALVPTIQDDPPVSIVCTEFSMTILTIDSTDSSVSSIVMTINVNVYTSSNTLVKSKSCNLVDVSGCLVSGYQISTPGSYYCTVTDTSASILSQTSIFSVISDIQVIQIQSFPPEPSAYFDFILTVKLRDNCGSLVTQSTNIEISGLLVIIGTLSLASSSGSASFNVYCPEFGAQVVTATAGGLSNTLSMSILQDILKITNINPTPSIENTFFQIIVKVFSNSGSSVASKYGPFSVTLELDPVSSNFSGVLTKNTINGVATFNDISANMSGTFNLTATSTNIIAAVTTFTLDPAVITLLVLMVTPNPVSTNFDFTVNVTVKDQISRQWWKPCQLDASGNFLGGLLSQTAQSGSIIFTLHFQQSGNQNLTFTTEGFSNSTIVSVLQNIIKIVSISPTPMFILTDFTISIKVLDYTEKILESTRGSYIINLETEPLPDCIQGTVTKTTTAGLINFTGLQFNQTGIFKIKVSSSDLKSTSSSQYSIIKLNLASIHFQIPVITVDFEFKIKVQIKDQFGNPWLSNTEIILISSIPVQGLTTQSTTSAEVTFTLKFSESGISQLSFLADLVTQITSVLINQKFLEITNSKTNENDKKLYISEIFWVQIRVLDFTKTKILDQDGLDIELKIIFKGESIGSYLDQTQAGVCVFNGLSLVNIGIFQVFAGGKECLNVTAVLPSVIYGPVTEIVIEKPVNLFYSKYLYWFTISLFNSTSHLIPYETQVSVYKGQNLLFRQNSYLGSANFPLFFNESGTNRFIVSVESMESQFECIVETGNNTDTMCIVSLNDTYCSLCKNEATEVLNGYCQCVFSSSYNPLSQSCECSQGLQPSKGFCVDCGKYILRSEIYAYYTSSYKNIIISFKKRINYLPLDSCQKILSYQSVFFQYKPKCYWSHPQELEISFERYPDLSIKSLELNNTLIQTTEGTCGYKVDRLVVEINKISSLPSVTGEINGPEQYSIKCAPGDLVIKFSVFSVEFEFEWKIISQASSQLIQLVEDTSDPVLYIPKNLLTPGQLIIYLTVKIPALNVEFSATKLVNIVKEDVLSLEFNIGNWFELYSDEILVIQVVSLSICSAEIPDIVWIAPDIPNLEGLIKASKKSTQLMIPAYTLNPKTKYKIKVLAGNTIIQTTLSVLSKDLVLSLSRSNGVIPLNSWLEITAKPVDPDNNSTQFVYKWTCSHDFNPCYNRFGQVIQFDSYKESVKVSNDSLIDKNTYRFQVKVSSIDKIVTGFVDLYVDSKIKGVVEIPGSDLDISSRQLIKILPKVSFNTKVVFKWEISGGKFEVGNTDLGAPFFCALGSQFELGSSFKFQLIIIEKNVETVIGELEIKSKSGPDCEQFTINLNEPFYLLSGKGCWDTDDKDYPLKYQFGSIELENTPKPFTTLSYNSDFYGFVPKNSKKLSLKVCDSSNTCSLFYNTIKRRLLEQNIQYYIEQLQYEEKIPNIILVLDGEKLTKTEFSDLFSAFLKYFNQVEIDQESFTLLYSCLNVIQSFENFNQEYFDSAFNMVRQVLEKFEYILNNDELGDLLDLLYINRYYLSKGEFLDIVSVLLEKTSSRYLPTYTLAYDKLFIAYLYKTYSFELNNFYVRLSGFSIEFPEKLNINETDLVDLRVISFDFNESFYLEIKLNKTGVYKNYNIELVQPKVLKLSLDSPIKVNLNNQFLYNDSVCEDFFGKSTEKCSIKDLSLDLVTVNFYGFGQFSVSKLETDCINDETAPLIGLTIYCLAGIYSISIILYNLKSSKSFIKTHPVFKSIPVASAFLPQMMKNRVISTFQLSSSLITLLCLCKLSKIYIYPTDAFTKYSENDLLSGFIAFLILQPHTFFSIFIQIHLVKGKLNNFPLVFSILTSTLSLLTLGYLFYSNCEGKSYNWILNFIIFAIFEVFVIHPIYASIIWRCGKKKVQNFTRPVTLGDEPNSRTGALAAISLDNIPEDENTENQTSPKGNGKTDLNHLFEKRVSRFKHTSSLA